MSYSSTSKSVQRLGFLAAWGGLLLLPHVMAWSFIVIGVVLILAPCVVPEKRQRHEER